MKNIALITGGRSGIGLELTKMLLGEGWKVISMDRSEFPLTELSIKEAFSNGSLIQYCTDLSNFKKLRNTLCELSENEVYIDVIFNNAGSMSGDLQFSAQGREMDYEVNSVAPYIITRHLTPLLKKGRLKTIINTSSNAALRAKSFDAHQLGNPTRFVKLFGSYAASKLALSLWTKRIAPLLLKDDIRIRSVDPGPSKTPMSLGPGMPWFVRLVRPFVFSTPRKGAQNLYDAAFGKFRSDSGNFIMKGKNTTLSAFDSASVILEELERIFLQTVDEK
jgi:NAD(P)-dependent dehydrogenase (short-subunit alcohol dehydrogenase family)